ncbi:2-succinylbenzoate--CoA ligase, chloroplastic/peroxisomal isoform X3 [Spinacia oleracea]|uniref:2-succinylbenzoate--CoA ligase, chloroplastic/peroxisomal isoform X3 n=1 Tax=Spinacia oleracea TaxID=3562 RepID=A0A9R0JBE7_SPIOL|nr:2-succinylbenzoate--CoA ligase, chloroplastic/peroxisomal isoform X3 [Spinacia oleracea]
MGDWSRAHICQCLNRLLTLRGNSTVTIAQEQRKSGEQFVESVLSLAHKLCQLGLCRGQIVAICAFNSDSYLEWLLAVAYIGGIIAPLNYRWSLEESKVALEVIRPAMIVTDECCTWLSDLRNGTMFCPRWHVSVGFHYSTSNGIQECERLSINLQSIKYCWAPDNVVIICFTSGSTGKPKGVAISHASLIMQSLAKIAIVGYAEDDVYLHTAPLCHIGGISSCISMLMVGGCHVLIPKFEVKMALKAIEENHVTSFITVPAMLASLVSTMRNNKSRNLVESVKKILNGGGSLSLQLVEDSVRCFHRAKLLSAYGMTETCSSLTFITVYDPAINNRHLKKIRGTVSNSVHPIGGICVGKPAPHVELLVIKEELSHVGRIMTRGLHVMIGYWGQISGLEIDSSGDWFDTGDSGHIDAHGNLWLVGRRNCRIKSGGENVYPEEVEVVLSQHPGILAVVVIGLPDAHLGEMVVACVQIRDNWIWTDLNVGELQSNMERHLSTGMLKEFCRHKSLTGSLSVSLFFHSPSPCSKQIRKLKSLWFKIPRAFMIWRKPFPLTSTGKVKRDQVKAEAISHLQPFFSNL